MASFLTVVFVDAASPDPIAAAAQLLKPHFAADLTTASHAKCDGFDARPTTDGGSVMMPTAAVTPDGQWHDCVGRTDAEWETLWGLLCWRHADRRVVAFDCHH